MIKKNSQNGESNFLLAAGPQGKLMKTQFGLNRYRQRRSPQALSRLAQVVARGPGRSAGRLAA